MFIPLNALLCKYEGFDVKYTWMILRWCLGVDNGWDTILMLNKEYIKGLLEVKD